jgi:hypothetical protein
MKLEGSGATDIDDLYNKNKLSIEDILKPVSTETNVSLIDKPGKTLEGLQPVSLAPAIAPMPVAAV